MTAISTLPPVRPGGPRPQALILTATAISLLYLATVCAFGLSLGGIIRAGNQYIPALVSLLGGAALFLIGLVALVLAIRTTRQKRRALATAYAITGAIFLPSPFLAHAILPEVSRRAELRDVNHVGLERLRAEATALVALGQTKTHGGYFGDELSSSDLTPAIRTLSSRANYVAVNDNGIVIALDGLGSWRGGYMITPTGSSYIPPWSIKITDGVFYVTTH